MRLFLMATIADALLSSLSDEILRAHSGFRSIIAVDGVDGSGKTTFADDLAGVMRQAPTSLIVFRASIDSFHRPRADRYARGKTSPEGYYHDSFDYSKFMDVLIRPFQGGASYVQLSAFDHRTDSPVTRSTEYVPQNAVLIVDGIFLHRLELRGLWTRSVWLEVDFAESYRRMSIRDGCDPNPEAASNWRYWRGQQIYLEEAQPRRAASLIVDNNDWTNPVRLR